MDRLSHSETLRLLKSLSVLHSQADLASLPGRVIGSVSLATSAEIIAVDSFNQAGRYPGESWPEQSYSHVGHHANDLSLNESWVHPTGSVAPEVYEILVDYADTHPLMGEFQKNGLEIPLKISDLMSNRQFRETTLYNEFYRVIGCDKQMITGLPVSSTSTLTLSLLRQSKDFTDNERRVLSALRPHLILACRNALAVAEMTSGPFNNVIGCRMCAITLDWNAKLRFMSVQAQELLGKYFGTSSHEHDLPEEVNRWLKQELSTDSGKEAPPLVAPLIIRRAEGELRIHLVPNEASEQHLLLLDEKYLSTPTSSLKNLPLTEREVEILSWVAQGKTNAVISELCGLSIRTVEKHLERVYQKLGVETRTAAARTAFEALNPCRC